MASWEHFNALPHMGPHHAAILGRYAQRAKRILEYGSGGSTLFLAMVALKARIVSLEHDREWRQRVTRALEWERMEGWEMAPVEVYHVSRDGYRWANWSWTKAPGASFIPDLVFVDGLDRDVCLKDAWTFLPSGGIVILHDAERPYVRGEGWETLYEDVDKDWLENPAAKLWVGRKP